MPEKPHVGRKNLYWGRDEPWVAGSMWDFMTQKFTATNPENLMFRSLLGIFLSSLKFPVEPFWMNDSKALFPG